MGCICYFRGWEVFHDFDFDMAAQHSGTSVNPSSPITGTVDSKDDRLEPPNPMTQKRSYFRGWEVFHDFDFDMAEIPFSSRTLALLLFWVITGTVDSKDDRLEPPNPMTQKRRSASVRLENGIKYTCQVGC
jgi:hypothetical protein